MIYDEVGSGGVLGGGCSLADVRRHSSTRFAPGDILYDLKKANRGVLQAVTIKEVRIARRIRYPGQPMALYVDTFNSFWNERDLTDYATALALVTEYLDVWEQQVMAWGDCPR